MKEKKVKKMIISGEIKDTTSIAAILLAEKRSFIKF